MTSSGQRARFTSRKLSRRAALKAGAAGMGAAALALAGCAGEGGSLEGLGDTATPSATDVPQYGGDEIMGLIADPGGLDVAQSVTGFWCSALMNGYLHSVNTADRTLEPQMARERRGRRQDDLRLEAPAPASSSTTSTQPTDARSPRTTSSSACNAVAMIRRS